jgi:hypothetical protein
MIELETGENIRNMTHEEIKRRLNSGNACYSVFSHVAQKRKNQNIQNYTILLWFCVGVKLGLCH